MYPQAYLDYLVHFHGDRDYFECHEILEEHWKSMPAGRRSPVWVGLIQIAVALYHQRRNNRAGALKMMQSAVNLLNREQAALEQLGLDAPKLIRLLNGRLEELQQNAPYSSFNLPIKDETLLSHCREQCQLRGFSFGQESNLADEFLLNKHKLRDRTEVIEERARQLQQKQARREEP
ncbi:DUF309 domain-containing protein [Brevibacillus sp. H7]|uniref:DUF309 domain-containing protein n=1 Tax=Brevibacillus sp. H7 TaxID=3349138 RepID=UPI00382335D2